MDIKASKEWTLRRNCVLTPNQFGFSFILLGLISLLIGILWAFNGVWVIMPFVILEFIALAVAFIVYSLHATDCEKIILTNNEIFFECEDGGEKRLYKIPRYSVRTNLERNKEEGLVSFCWGNKKICIGKFVDFRSRERFYGEIRGYL
jgi:uncharacterized membrane protein